jgi:hypothetical protein
VKTKPRVLANQTFLAEGDSSSAGVPLLTCDAESPLLLSVDGEEGGC